MRLLTFSAIAISLGLLGCSKAGNKKPDDDSGQDRLGIIQGQTPKILDYSDFDEQSFNEISWERKCEGLARFFELFVDNYLPADVKASTDISICKESIKFAKEGTEFFTAKITLTRGSKSFIVNPDITAKYSDDRQSLKITDSQLFLTANALSPKDDFGENMVSLTETFTDWANKRSDEVLNVFSMPSPQFAQKVSEKFGANSPGLTFTVNSKTLWRRDPVTDGPDALDLSQRWLTIKLNPFADMTSGELTVENAGLEIFRELDHQGKAVSTPFFGCFDLNCLQQLKFRYKLYGAKLFMSADLELDGNVKTRSQFVFSFSDQNLK